MDYELVDDSSVIESEGDGPSPSIDELHPCGACVYIGSARGCADTDRKVGFPVGSAVREGGVPADILRPQAVEVPADALLPAPVDGPGDVVHQAVADGPGDCSHPPADDGLGHVAPAGAHELLSGVLPPGPELCEVAAHRLLVSSFREAAEALRASMAWAIEESLETEELDDPILGQRSGVRRGVFRRSLRSSSRGWCRPLGA